MPCKTGCQSAYKSINFLSIEALFTRTAQASTNVCKALSVVDIKKLPFGSLFVSVEGLILATTYSRSEELPSALGDLTAEFEMGSGVALPPSHQNKTLNLLTKRIRKNIFCTAHSSHKATKGTVPEGMYRENQSED